MRASTWALFSVVSLTIVCRLSTVNANRVCDLDGGLKLYTKIISILLKNF